MKKAERLNGIIYALKERGKLTGSELAQIFEVSDRTIYRDVDALSQLNVPIFAHEGKNGGYEIDLDYFIPSIKLTEQEIIMLLMILKIGEEIKFPNLTGDYKLLKSKIINILADTDKTKVDRLLSHISFYISRVRPGDYRDNVLLTVLYSFMESQMIHIAYYNPANHEIVKRNVSPTELFYDEGGWYLSGFCHKRNEKRTFRLDRIKEIEILEQENKYIGKTVQSSNDKFQEKEYLLEINRSLFRLIKDNFYMKHSDVITDDEPMKIKIVCKYEEDITSMVLRNPKSVRVLGPETYQKYLKGIVQELSNKYI